MLCPYLLISINELLISIISFNDINKYGLNVKTAAHKGAHYCDTSDGDAIFIDINKEGAAAWTSIFIDINKEGAAAWTSIFIDIYKEGAAAYGHPSLLISIKRALLHGHPYLLISIKRALLHGH